MLENSTAKTHQPATTDKLLRLEQVMEITSLCRSHVFSLIKKGQFPASITIGARGARWSNNEVQHWISTQVLNARKAPGTTTNEAA